MATDPTRLDQLLGFSRALDRLKQVERRSPLMDNSRRENSAEHSWHAAVMAQLLSDYAAEPIDLSRTVAMLLLHDVIEVEAGDTFCYDAEANQDKQERELAAADTLFGLLPSDMGGEVRDLWEEFEAAESPEARFAHAMDRFQALLQNFHSQGGTWQEYGVPRSWVLKRMGAVRTGAPGLWPRVIEVLDLACLRGYLRDDSE
ncbi:MAG: HD domain-containing protein [Desulfohalobiaceae bacterium]